MRALPPGRIGRRSVVRFGCNRRSVEEKADRVGTNGRVLSRVEVQVVSEADDGGRQPGGWGLKHQPRPKSLWSDRKPTLEQVVYESAQIVAQNQQDRKQDNRYKNQQQRIFNKTLTAAT